MTAMPWYTANRVPDQQSSATGAGHAAAQHVSNDLDQLDAVTLVQLLCTDALTPGAGTK
jgi:hypothetical protein